MKSYIYTYQRGRQDVNGNPRHWITVYRVKRNQPILLQENEDVGYRSYNQAVKAVIARQEKTSIHTIARAHIGGRIKITQV